MRRWILKYMIRIFIVFCFFFPGCSIQPDEIYIPAPDYKQSLDISFVKQAGERIFAGEWIELNAKRETGPWMRVQYSKEEKYDIWWSSPPPPVEDNVQSNVRWIITPPDVKFNMPGANGDTILTRKVRFEKPGAYKVYAVSNGVGYEFQSNVITVEVLKK